MESTAHGKTMQKFVTAAFAFVVAFIGMMFLPATHVQNSSFGLIGCDAAHAAGILSADRTSVAVEKDGTASVNISIAPVNGTYYKKYYSVANEDVVSCSWGTKANGTQPLLITGKCVGATTVTIRNVYNSDELDINVTVTRINPSMSFASLSVTKNISDGPFKNILSYSGDGAVTYSSTNTSVATVSTEGWVTIKGTGSCFITASAAETSTYFGFARNYKLTVLKTPTMKFAGAELHKYGGDSSFTNALTYSGDGTVTYSSSDTSVATVSTEGQVAIKGAGTCQIDATAAATSTYSACSASYTLKVSKSSPTLYFKYPQMTSTIGDPGCKADIICNDNGSLVFSSSNTDVAVVSSDGTAIIRGIGSCIITATMDETSLYNFASAHYELIVNPKASAITKLVAKVNGKKHIVKVICSKQKAANCTGYQIFYSLKKSMKGSKVVKTTKATKSVRIPKSWRGKKVYFQVRVYKKVDGKTYRSDYSAVKKVKAK